MNTTDKTEHEEIEVKFLNIDPIEISEKLRKIGAQKVFERTYRRKVFDYPDLRMDQRGAWLRLRDEGKEITLCYKQRLGVKGHGGRTNDEGMEEIQVIVDDFEKTAKILLRIGLIEKHYVENKRTRYLLDDIEFDIDTYPLLEPFLEIEASSWEKVDQAIKLLGLAPEKKRIFSTTQIYSLKGIKQNDYQEMTFERQVKKKKEDGTS